MGEVARDHNIHNVRTSDRLVHCVITTTRRVNYATAYVVRRARVLGEPHVGDFRPPRVNLAESRNWGATCVGHVLICPARNLLHHWWNVTHVVPRTSAFEGTFGSKCIRNRVDNLYTVAVRLIYFKEFQWGNARPSSQMLMVVATPCIRHQSNTLATFPPEPRVPELNNMNTYDVYVR